MKRLSNSERKYLVELFDGLSAAEAVRFEREIIRELDQIVPNDEETRLGRFIAALKNFLIDQFVPTMLCFLVFVFLCFLWLS